MNHTALRRAIPRAVLVLSMIGGMLMLPSTVFANCDPGRPHTAGDSTWTLLDDAQTGVHFTAFYSTFTQDNINSQLFPPFVLTNISYMTIALDSGRGINAGGRAVAGIAKAPSGTTYWFFSLTDWNGTQQMTSAQSYVVHSIDPGTTFKITYSNSSPYHYKFYVNGGLMYDFVIGGSTAWNPVQSRVDASVRNLDSERWGHSSNQHRFSNTRYSSNYGSDVVWGSNGGGAGDQYWYFPGNVGSTFDVYDLGC